MLRGKKDQTCRIQGNGPFTPAFFSTIFSNVASVIAIAIYPCVCLYKNRKKWVHNPFLNLNSCKNSWENSWEKSRCEWAIMVTEPLGVNRPHNESTFVALLHVLVKDNAPYLHRCLPTILPRTHRMLIQYHQSTTHRSYKGLGYNHLCLKFCMLSSMVFKVNAVQRRVAVLCVVCFWWTVTQF